MEVSVLITANGRTEQLRRSLVRMCELTPPTEVVLVDDGTPDDSVQRVWHEASTRRPRRTTFRYLRNENPGMTNCCHARNVGLLHCDHDEVLVTEPEVWFVSDVIAQLAAARADRPDEILQSSTCYHAPSEVATMNLDACDLVPAWPYVHSWRRGWLEEIGGWDEDLPGPWGWDDIDLLGRAAASGHVPHPVEGVRIHHQWHPSRIEPAAENEAHARGKTFPRDIVANKGREWGRIKL